MLLTLYVNDPMGRRCRINMDAARKLQEEYPIQVRVVKHGSDEYHSEKYPPPCPSVMLDGRIIKEYGVMTTDEMRLELLRFLA